MLDHYKNNQDNLKSSVIVLSVSTAGLSPSEWLHMCGRYSLPQKNST